MPEIDYEYTEFNPEATENAHKYILQNFANAIIKGENLLSPGIEGVNELMISNAAYLSSWQGNKEILPIELVDGRKVNITLRTSTNINGKECYERTETEDFYKEWVQKTGFDLPLNTENPSPEDPSPEDQEKESSFSCIFQVLIMLIILLGIAWWKGWI